MVALSPQRIERHVFEHVVHPAHVPLEQEAKTAVIIWFGNQRKSRRFLGDHHDRRIGLERRLVEFAQKINRFEILPASKFIGLELSAIIVQIQHGRNCIDSNSVDMKITKPVTYVGNEEGLYLGLAVIVNAGCPVRVLIHHRVGKLVAAGSIKLKQAVFILWKMSRHPVENNAEPSFVTGIDKLHKLLRCPVAVRRCKIAGDLIAPRRIVGIFHNRKQFNMRISHVFDRGNKFCSQFFIIEIAAVLVPFPGASVNLIDIDRALDCRLSGCSGAVERIVPLKAVQRINHAGGVW